MLFNSIQFLIFFPITIAVFFILPHKFRKYFLLASSCYFYMSFIPKYIFILLYTTLVDYSGARIIEYFRLKNCKGYAKSAFIISLVLNVGLLVYYKYLGLIGDTINFFGMALNLKTIVIPEIVLPIGISFHTFQSMGYLIDVYTGKEKAEPNFIDFSLFLMYFPQLVAGPIERSRNLFSQLKAEHYLSYDNVSKGGRLMLWGMFKKVVVADNLAIIADMIFGNVSGYSGMYLIVGILCFTVQIYCDFSGYSDIAIGSAKVMDITLMKNFDTPYFSSSVSEFWRRWHISLSTWFRDYIYIPLGGNRVSYPKWCFNQLITFAVSGIWHGANFTFAVWGLLNGIYIIIARTLAPIRKKLAELTHLDKIPKITKIFWILFTFALIAFTWIFFRADSFSDAFYIISNMFGSSVGDLSKISDFRKYIAIGSTILLFVIEFLMKKEKITEWYVKAPSAVRLISYACMVFIIVVFGAYDNKSFIYFQF